MKMCREAELKRKFKAEDKVRRIKHEFKGMKFGDIGTVAGIFNNGIGIYLKEFSPKISHTSDHFELAKPQVGDKVKIVKKGNKCSGDAFCCSRFIGKEGVIKEINYRETNNIWVYPIFVNSLGSKGCSGFTEDCLKLISKGGSKMSKYEELKKKIEGMNEDTTLKETDDLLQEIYQNLSSAYYSIEIGVRDHEERGGWQDIFIRRGLNGEIVQKFGYSGQCDKMSQLKNAFQWLLDCSDIKKNEKQEEIDKLKKELEDFRGKTNKKIKELEKQC